MPDVLPLDHHDFAAGTSEGRCDGRTGQAAADHGDFDPLGHA